ncbi:MAG TPA: DUF2911 domain-containing protein [Salinimicrobium sp.]|nr:DUF2911 domain-containing protein [Salinimicrobium sp.]
MKKILLIFALLFSGISFAQIQTPQPSPYGKIEQVVGLTDVTVEYSRPGMRDREIFGGLVPFGEMWRTGANENTKITFSDPVEINGKKLDAGTYAIFTVPSKNQWDVIFYSDVQNWGLPQKWDDSKVALKTTAKVINMPLNMETFTILIDELKNDSAVLNFLWENTIASLEFKVPTEEKAMTSIKQIMNGPTGSDYYAAANYYYETGKDLKQALNWINKAVKENDAFYILRKKALIQAELGMKKKAIETARLSLEGAKKANNKDYVKMNEASIKEWGS